ncbi:MAG TPA: hypothetical protein VLQ48_08825 [Chloroflexia bacterium]|nr:hypothetical protein [Chloroflexia bacterium]
MMDINPEDLAYWYLRLNGFLTIQDLVVHPDWGTNQGTDIDILGVRFPYRAENLKRPMEDAVVFSNVKDKPFVAVVEVKKGLCCLNKSWLDKEKPNLHRVIRFLGILPINNTEEAAETLYKDGMLTSESYHISLTCIGETQNYNTTKEYPQVLQITWDEVLPFIFERFADYHRQKSSHRNQWDDLGNYLWDMRERHKRDMPGFVIHIKDQLVEKQK